METTYRVARWSEDQADYPRWHDDPERRVRVLDLIAAAVGFRFEMGDVTAIPPKKGKIKKLVSMSSLGRR